MKKKLFLMYFFFITFFAYNQENNLAVGGWRSHFPYNNIISVTSDNKGNIYAASEYSIFSYSKKTGLINIISKINKLSDVGISCIKYDVNNDFLFIAYKNSNIDIIKNGKTINIPDIYRSNIIGKKSINNVFFLNNYAYLSCGFGIVVVNLKNYEIADSYFIGNNGSYVDVKDFTYFEKENKFVAATAIGLFLAENSPNNNLSYFGNWNLVDNFPSITKTVDIVKIFNEKAIFTAAVANSSDKKKVFVYDGNNFSLLKDTIALYGIDVVNDYLVMDLYQTSDFYDVNYNKIFTFWRVSQENGATDVPYPNQTIVDENGVYWVADRMYGLVYHTEDWNGKSIIPSGPPISMVFNIVADDDKIFTFQGGYDLSWCQQYRKPIIGVFENNEWNVINNNVIEGLNNSYTDIVDIAIDPINNKHYFLASYGKGLIEVLNNKVIQVYNEENSPLTSPLSPSDVRVGSVKFDKDKNLWISNCASGQCLHVLTPSGNWGNLNVGSSFFNVEVANITIDHSNQKWMKSRNAGQVYVFNDNHTPNDPSDDYSKVLTTAVGNGAIPGQTIYSIACDYDGKVWIGTDKGVAVFYYPEKIFTGENFDASQILVETPEDIRPLLEGETVTAICVDFGNNKWFGTASSGVYYTSADGKTELEHFSKENSSLLSNNISGIEINSKGEVFFVTEEGVCSYKSASAIPQEDFSSILAYPNPVRPEYDGPIAIQGLKTNSYVKICDAAGKVVFSSISNGGQVVWNGFTPSGQKAASGVYVVFVVEEGGKEKARTKILIVR